MGERVVLSCGWDVVKRCLANYFSGCFSGLRDSGMLECDLLQAVAAVGCLPPHNGGMLECDILQAVGAVVAAVVGRSLRRCSRREQQSAIIQSALWFAVLILKRMIATHKRMVQKQVYTLTNMLRVPESALWFAAPVACQYTCVALLSPTSRRACPVTTSKAALPQQSCCVHCMRDER